MASAIVKVIILDQSNASVVVASIEHNKDDDMEVSVSDYLDTIDKKMSECSWMELPSDFEVSDIEEDPELSTYMVARAGERVRVQAISEASAEKVASADYYGDRKLDWKESEYTDDEWDVVKL